mmetsp:Transcript_6024/g.12713  ORF Transcript_6024/g.12713 Transcript_6024/m.12713 type:complete len:97 (+) Transcript_6024:53-343(+)
MKRASGYTTRPKSRHAIGSSRSASGKMKNLRQHCHTFERSVRAYHERQENSMIFKPIELSHRVLGGNASSCDETGVNTSGDDRGVFDEEQTRQSIV